MFIRSAVVIGLFAAMALAADEKNVTYLALGDSIAFGFDPLKLGQPAENFTGYPEVVADTKEVKHLKKLVNTSCPGETIGSFINVKAPDNGCHPNDKLPYPQSVGYKAAFGLHTNYPGSQLEEALFLLQIGRKIELVTIDLGGNDLLLLQSNCNGEPTCIKRALPDVLTSYGNNLPIILTALRKGGYAGTIVLLTFYSPDYSDSLQTKAVLELDIVASVVATVFGAKIADGFTAFGTASFEFGGKPCDAGLLIKLPTGTCNVHPSPAGQTLLANTIVNLLGEGKSGNGNQEGQHGNNN